MTRASRVSVLVLLGSAGILAQTSTGTIVGTVLDTAQAVVPEASVTVTNTGTNEISRAVTGAAGTYIVPLLKPGSYRVEVTAPGFKKFRQDGIVLQVQQQARVDVALQVGDVAESIDVVADAAVVETTSSSVGKVVDNKRIGDLPLNTRNVYGLINLTPGVSGGIGNSHNQVGYSVNGVRGGLFDTLVDGSSAAFPTVNGFHGISVFPSVDAVAEFKVQASNYSAEFGRSNGSVLNLVYKSGTNDFHGSAYEFLRNSVLDANNYFNNQRNIPLASFKRNQFGGTFSGPLRKDKTFFLVSYEGLRERSFSETLTTVPTSEQRLGDFSLTQANLTQQIVIFDPLTTRANPAGGFIRTAFPGNRIPADRIDPVARNVLAYYPQPNQAGLPGTRQQNFYNAGSAAVDTNNYDLRIDHNLSERQRIFGRISRRYSFNGPPQLFPGETGAAEGRINLNDWGTNAVFDYANTLTGSSILNLRLSFARNLFLFDNQGLGFQPSTLGLPRDLDAAVDLPMFPRFGVAGQVNLGGNDHRKSGFNQYGLVGNYSKIVGSHSIKAGYEGRLLRINVWEARAAGTFNFNAGFTQGPNPNQASATAGYGLASFLLGTGSGGNFYQNWKNVAAESYYHAFYIQDDWRVTRKLTLNLGIRYDFDTPRTERYDRMSWFDPTVRSPLASTPGFSNLTGGLQFVGVGDNPRVQYDGDWNNIAPRLGFAYQINPKTVIRGGWAQMFASSTLGAQGTVGPYGFRVETPWISTLDGITPQNLLRNPFPGGFRPVPGARDGLLTAVGGNVEGPLRETPVPYTLQWNLTIQRELPGQILLETAYVGNRGRQLSRGGEGGFTLNQIHPSNLSLGSQLNQLVANPFFGQGLPGVLANPTISRAQLLRPYPQFLSVHPLFSAGSNSDYHALQVSFSKRYSKGIVFEGNYVWAKSIDDGTSALDSYNLRLGRSPTGTDIRHRLVFSGVYELPFGKGRQFGSSMSRWADLLVGGWQVNGILTMQSGGLLGIGASNTSGLFNEAARANNNGRSAKLDIDAHDRLDRWFDTSVFSQPAPFTLGNVGTLVPDLRAHHVNNLDFSLFKQFQITERARLQFRAESFNFANRVQFAGPNTSVTAGTAFGRVTSQANAPRQIQFGLKLLF
ncbi:MAG: TonB-dependent receptor [Bryobacteraceae bacterium]|nr:TonB-dependent receptor [Bryobacteraceae bacterium]